MSKINGFFSLAIAKTGGSGITAVFWFIIAALLIPSEYGQIQYFISIAGIAYTISLIGTQEVITVYTAKKIDLQKTLISIKKFLKSHFRSKNSFKILYGGSVDHKSIHNFKLIKDLDGFLIGGASKSSKKFIDIIKNFYK